MKTITTLGLIGAAALSVTAGAASAQPWRNDHGLAAYGQREAMLERRIDRGIRDGSLTRQEAWNLKNELNRLTRLEARYRMNGLNWRERADLDRGFDRLSARIRMQRHDSQYGYGYGYDHRYDRR